MYDKQENARKLRVVCTYNKFLSSTNRFNLLSSKCHGQAVAGSGPTRMKDPPNGFPRPTSWEN
jgi:hypothetical protein